MLTASCPVTGHGWEESGSIFFISLHQIIYTHWEDPSLKPSFLQADNFQLSQLLLVRQMFQFLNYLCDPLLDSLQYVHVPLLLGSPEVDIVLQLWSHQGSGEEKYHPLNLLLRVNISPTTGTLTLFCSCPLEKELFSCRYKSQALTSQESPFLNPVRTDSSCTS